MEELMGYFNSIHPLSENLINYLADIIRPRILHKKDFLLKKGHISQDIYFIKKGMLRCFYLIDDKEVTSWFMKEHDIVISVHSFFNQVISKEFIQALEDSELYSISYTELQYIYKNFPEFNFIGRVFTERYYTLSEQRLYAMRMQRAQDKYQFLLDYHRDLLLRVPSKFLASYMGITEVTLSNMKALFKIS